MIVFLDRSTQISSLAGYDVPGGEAAGAQGPRGPERPGEISKPH